MADNDKPARLYPPDAVLTIDQVADWLGVSKRQVERLDIPTTRLGARTRRFLAKEVMRFLEKRTD